MADGIGGRLEVPGDEALLVLWICSYGVGQQPNEPEPADERRVDLVAREVTFGGIRARDSDHDAHYGQVSDRVVA